MNTSNGLLGWIVGGLVALMAIFFIFSGGSLGGKTNVDSDRDLPPIANSGD